MDFPTAQDGRVPGPVGRERHAALAAEVIRLLAS
jgi:hypothetical protein